MENVDAKAIVEAKVMNEVKDAAIGGSVEEYVSRLYVTPEVAKEEIWKRWNNEELRREVSNFLGNDIPSVFERCPRIVLARHIVSPNWESIHFLKLAQEVDLQPLYLEYLNDRFTSGNFDKYHLAKLFFYDGKGKRGGDKVSAEKIADIEKYHGEPICNVNTKWGESLVTFHHRIFQETSLCDDYESNTLDVSSWYARHGGNAKAYYPNFLAFFLCYGVLAELFLLYTEEDRIFFENTVMPALDMLEKKFGILPLITPISSLEQGADLSWKYYPEFTKKMILEGALS